MPEHKLPLAARMAAIQPFHVMALLARARQLEAAGRDIVHMEIGEPDFSTAAPIIEAGRAALADGHTHYTPAAGLPALRTAIADDYRTRHGIALDPARILITPGASGALLLVLAALLEPGKALALSDPGYPCNSNFAHLFGADALRIACGARTRYQLTAALLAANWETRIGAVLVASPSNPTGTVLTRAELVALAELCADRSVPLIVDEIYHGLTYDADAVSVLDVTQHAFVINSFSKFFGMTGWRLGWVVAPEYAIEPLDRLAQNLFLAAPTPAQHAALAAFTPAAQTEFETRRQAFQARRDYLLPALRELGFKIPVEPEGAFYIYADCSAFTNDSFHWCSGVLEKIGVAITPGIDFGEYRAHQHVRFAYTTSLERLQEGVERLRDYLTNAS